MKFSSEGTTHPFLPPQKNLQNPEKIIRKLENTGKTILKKRNAKLQKKIGKKKKNASRDFREEDVVESQMANVVAQATHQQSKPQSRSWAKWPWVKKMPPTGTRSVDGSSFPFTKADFSGCTLYTVCLTHISAERVAAGPRRRPLCFCSDPRWL